MFVIVSKRWIDSGRLSVGCLFFTTVLIASLVVMCGVAVAEGGVDIHQIERAFMEVADKVMPTVVSINTGYRTGGEPYEELFKELPFKLELPELPEGYERGKGSGFIVESTGYIITNTHVLEDAEKIEVELYDGRKYPARVVGVDPRTDIALIKIEPEGELQAAVLGDSDRLRIGQYAIAIGNPGDYNRTMSVGHITGLGRTLRKFIGKITHQNFIQTDASINLGNSGGPLVNIDGEVIGINTAVIAGAQSIGFAIPINFAKSRLEELKRTGKVTYAYLGVNIQDVPCMVVEKYRLPDRCGALISNVVPGSAAERAGLRVYDVVRSVNGKPVRCASELQSVLALMEPGETVEVEVYRDGEPLRVGVVLGEMEPEQISIPARERSIDRRAVMTWGITVEAIPEAELRHMKLRRPSGVWVRTVEPGSLAYDAAIEPRDVILEVERNVPHSVGEFEELRKRYTKPGAVIELLVQSGVSGDPATTYVKFIKVPELPEPDGE